ncbi:MAG: Flp pilus assembly protein CpaB [Nitrospirota bacterium]
MALPAKITATIAVAALVLASVSAYMVYSYLSAKDREAARAKMEVQQVVIAASEIPFGTRTKPEQLKLADWPKTNIPAGSSGNLNQSQDRLAIADIPAGAPVLESSLAPLNSGAGVMSYIIKPGKRAITVAVNEVVGVAGFVLPNSMVDVVATVDNPVGKTANGKDNRISKIVLQDVRVLAVGQILEQKEGKPVSVPTVTLDVTPEDAEKLALASENKVQLILRHLDDTEVAKTRGETVASLLAGDVAQAQPHVQRVASTRRAAKAVKAVTVEAPAGVNIEVIKGSLRTNETYK